MLRIEGTHKGLLAAALITLTAASGLLAGQKQAAEPRAAREIRAVLDRQVAAWNNHDLEGFMEGYWRSPELSFYSNGTRTVGWQATIDRYRQRYQNEGRDMGRLEFLDVEVELLGPASAFVRGRYRLRLVGGDSTGLFTLIVRNLKGGWKIVHDHTGSAS